MRLFILGLLALLSFSASAQVASDVLYGVIRYDPASFTTVGTNNNAIFKLRPGVGGYTLPTASATVLGGIKVGPNLSIDANGVLSATTPSGGSSVWGTNGSSAYYTAGNVGVGTNAPFSRFHVLTGSGYSYNDGTILEAPSGDRVFNYPVQDQWWQWDTYRGSDGRRLPMSFNPSGGNVGIGVGNNTPAYTLDVGGTGIQIRGGGLKFPDGTVQTTAATSGGGGSSGFPAQLGTLVTTMTAAGIQAAINAATAGATIVLSGTYDCSGGTVEINKKINLVSYNKAVMDGGTGNHLLLKIYGCTGTRVSGIKFQATDTGSGYGLILVNEQGPVSDLEIRSCEFTAPNGNSYNAISLNPWSSGGNKVYHDNIRIINNYFHDLNRMGVEFTNNALDGTIRFKNLVVSHNIFSNLGTVDSYDGMAVSFSGENQYIICDNNLIREFKGYGIEFICSLDFSASNNNISTTKTFNGSNGSNGYNLTDGGQTEGGNAGRNPRRGSITGGDVNVPGRPFVFYYATDVAVNGGYYYAGQAINVQNSKRISLTGLQMESLLQSCLRFDYSSNCQVSGGRYSTENAVGGKYEQVGFFGTATGNSVVGAMLLGTSDNGVNIKQDAGVSGNKWANVFFGGAYLSN